MNLSSHLNQTPSSNACNGDGTHKNFPHNIETGDIACNQVFLSHSVSIVDELLQVTIGDFDENIAKFQLPQRKRKTCPTVVSGSFDVISLPSKKPKNSSTISRSRKSHASLRDALATEPYRSSSLFVQGPNDMKSQQLPSPPLPANNSLIFQLHCVSTTSKPDLSGAFDFNESYVLNENLAPQLHTTVSNSSCSSSNIQTNKVTDPVHSPVCAHDEDDTLNSSYGWFVEVDQDFVTENVDSVAIKCDLKALPTKEPIFKVSPDPRTSHRDVDVEWACAADTVDDVLGDFF